MAPTSQDDHQNDDVTRRSEAADTGESGDSQDASRAGRRSDEPLDFGEFVSRSVRSSADRFKRGSGSPKPSAPAPAEPAAKRPASRPSQQKSSRRERPARYWRDSLREQPGDEAPTGAPASQRFLGRQDDQLEAGEPDDGHGGGGFGDWWQNLIGGGDGGGPNRSMIAYFLLGLVVMLIIISLLVRAFGGSSTPSPDDTKAPVPTQIVAPGSGPDVIPQPTQPAIGEENGTPTVTPEIQRGGDNQLGGDQSRPEGTPGAKKPSERVEGLTPEVESPLAKECSDRCLVRVDSTETANILQKTGNRPSFAGKDVAWVIATPTQISLLDERADIDLVQDSEETLHLYMVTVPEESDPALVDEFGDVLDSFGRYRLVDIEKLPARVSTLANKGYNVNKVAPAPPRDPVTYPDAPALADIGAGELMGQVSDANVRQIILDLQASGSTDGTGVGTRYYTSGGNQIAADYLYQQLESFGLIVWYEDFLTPEGILLVNVVGEVPGEDTSEVYAVMAHLDSINIEASNAEAPGADDNSTGMAVSLEMARILVQYDLQHPVRFVFVNAEEVGIIGSSVWAKRANAENLAIDGVFNIDSVGSDRQGRLVVLNSDSSSAWLQDVLISVNSDYGLGQNIESRQNPQIVADDNMVRAEGINAVILARELYGWSPLHHSARDVSDKVSIDNVLTATYLVMLSVAELAK